MLINNLSCNCCKLTCNTNHMVSKDNQIKQSIKLDLLKVFCMMHYRLSVADLGFHEGESVKLSALAHLRKFVQTTPTSGQKPRPFK